MLTKQDVDQIRGVIREEVTSAVSSTEARLKGVINHEIVASENRMMAQIRASEDRMEIGFEQIRSDIRDVIENQQAVMEIADKKFVNHEDRIIRLEEITGLAVK